MLLKVYRNGPSRQRLSKGYSVTAITPPALADLVENWNRRSGLFPLTVDGRHPNRIHLNTGLVWLEAPSSRKNVARTLGQSVSQLADELQSRGAELVPNAVRASTASDWMSLVCGDEHFVETYGDAEREVCCNLFRAYSAAIIAATGRAGFTSAGCEQLNSRRLSISKEHYGARFFASVSPLHIERVARELRRETGISRVDLLDLGPTHETEAEPPGVKVRCIDGQLFIGSAIAHGLLCQAVALRARRLARDGRRIGSAPQSMIDANRARAIARGFRGRLEVEEMSGVRNEGSRRERIRIRIGAGDAFLDMLLELLPEFQILEAEYDEIAPLVLGPSLWRMGLPGVRNENDLLSSRFGCGQFKWDDFRQFLQRSREEERTSPSAAIRIENETRYPEQTRHVRGWWEALLRDNGEIPAPGQRAREREGARDGGHAPRRQRADPAAEMACSRLLTAFGARTDALSDSMRADILTKYMISGGYPDLDAVMHHGGRPGETLRTILKPGFDPITVEVEAVDWTEAPFRSALDSMLKVPLVSLRCDIEASRLREAETRFEALRKSTPPGLHLCLTQRRFGKERTSAVELLFLLVRQPGDGKHG